MPVLYGYWRSSATYRVRIGANLKGIAYQSVPINLLKKEQLGDAYAKLNPEKLLPAFKLDDGTVLTQSMAILEYIEEAYSTGEHLLPSDSISRGKVRAFANVIASDTHPIQNLRVINYLDSKFNLESEVRVKWVKHWIETGFTALESIAASREMPFLFSDKPTLAEVCLVPQVFNARRFGVDMKQFPNLAEVDSQCNELAAFQNAHPSKQEDAIG